MSFSRRLLIGGVLAGTTSIATKKPAAPAQAHAADQGWKTTRREARKAAQAKGDKRFRLAVIGAGAAGSEAIQRLVSREKTEKDVEVVAVCDVYKPRIERAIALAQLEPKDGTSDYNRILARKDLDAVVIATPSHWHFRMATEAMAAGKDVYLEPPLALSLEEAQQIRQMALSQKRVLQLNVPELHDPRYAQARELILEGAIGRVIGAQLTFSSNAIEGEWNEYVEEDASLNTVNWDLWQGPAVKRPFSGERFFRWRKYWDYSGGLATEALFYRLAPLVKLMDAPMPTRVCASGGIFVHKDREVPDTYTTLIEYPEFSVNLSASTATAAPNQFFGEVIYGNMGTIVFGKNSVQVHAEKVWEPKMPESKRGVHAFETGVWDFYHDHMSDFLDAVRARRQPLAGVDFGLQVMTPILLGVDSYRESRMRLYDARAQRVSERALPRLGYEGNGRNHPDGRKRRA